ncbi:hypothetical protein [Candidatus Endomicrobiellum trichonymphae]|uniref:DnaA-domain protein n=1 Tax=Endomicrobium trichonymphae TaxID=1408204 RepID=B1H0S7_ENDTX|nr:hypothetical protein [Candidatus Endomicrobium trichonymphae]BAG14254.1 DnaA-domain protein [Candidatus Endomicrobium trichonymphae]
MWNEIITELKEKIPTEWLEPIKEESFKDDILTLAVPDTYYAQKYETDYKPLIQNILKAKTGKAVGLQFQIVASKLLAEPVIKDEKPKTQLMKKTKFNGKPYFENPAEFVSIAKAASQVKETDIKNAELTSMPNKYGITNVASFSLLDSKFFTYPNDKRKKTKVEMPVRFSNGVVKVYNLYRGQFAINDNGYGQLTTTHAKIFFAIIHIWQKQNSRYADNKGFYAVVDISMRELAKQLGYQKVSGADYRRLLQRVKELVDFPMILSDGRVAHTFTFLNSAIGRTVHQSGKNKLMLRLTLNPFISKQFYERNVILRNPQCYKIKNPTAFKFLLCYDKRVVKGNNLKLNIYEVANDLELNISKLCHGVSVLKVAFRELNGYELNDSYRLYVELVKEEREWIVIAERISKEKQQPLKALLA